MSITRVHTIFHINLMFSSIEEDLRYTVIERCYWPLLRACEKTCVPLGLELTGITLSIIEAIDPTWICLLYTSPSPRDGLLSRMPSSA